MGLKDLNFSSNDVLIAASAILAQQTLANAYISQGVITISELRNCTETYGFEQTFNALKTRITNAKISYNDIFDILGSINKANTISEGVALQLIDDIYSYKLYQQTIDANVSMDSFFTLGNASTSPSRSNPTAPNRWADIFMGLVVVNGGNDWYNALMHYVLPSSSIKFNGLVVTNTVNGSYNIYANNLLNSTNTAYTPPTAFFPENLTDCINRLKKGAYSSIKSNWAQMLEGSNIYKIETGLEGLSQTDFPMLNVSLAAMYITGISNQNDMSGITVEQIYDIVDLAQDITSAGISDDLYNATTHTSKIPKERIFEARNDCPSILVDLKQNSTYDKVFSYIPQTTSQDINSRLVRRVIEETASTDSYVYSDSVKRIDNFAEFVGFDTKTFTDLYTGVETIPVNNSFIAVKQFLDGTGTSASSCTAERWNSTLTTNYVAKNLSFVNVMATWRHYKKTGGNINFSMLTTSEAIASYLTDDFTKNVTASAIFSSTGVYSLNDSENRWANYLDSCKLASGASLKVDTIYGALKIIATYKLTRYGTTHTAADVNTGILMWLNLTSVVTPYAAVRTDAPTIFAGSSITEQDDFWGLPSKINDLSNDGTAKRVLAKYILNPSSLNNQKFDLLNEPSNIPYFNEMVKIGSSVSRTTSGLINQEQIFGLDGACDANGYPIANWGPSIKIENATKNLAGYTQNIDIVLRIKNSSSRLPSTIQYWDDLQKLIAEYNLATIVNLPKPLQDKSNLFIINPTVGNATEWWSHTDNHPDTITGAYPGYTSGTSAAISFNKKMNYVALLIDMANAAKLNATTSATPYQKASNTQKILEVISDTSNNPTYKNFLELYVNFPKAAGNGGSNVLHTNMYSNLLQHKFISKFGKYGKSSQWRAAIVNTLNVVFDDQMLDDAMDPSTANPQVALLTLAKSNILKIAGDAIKYQLVDKQIFINPATNSAEVNDTLSNYVADIYTNPEYIKCIALGLAVASKTGNTYKLSLSEFNELKTAGVSEDTIKRMIVARQSISGYVVGGISFYTLVGQNPDGTLIYG